MRTERHEAHMTCHEGWRNGVATQRALTFALLWTACGLFGLARIEAATPLSDLRLSPDVSIALDGGFMNDDGVVLVNAGGVVGLPFIGNIPVQADVDAYHFLHPIGHLFSLDTAVELPLLTVYPGDVVATDGSFYGLAFDAASMGLPAGVTVDAVSMLSLHLLLSFDTSLTLNGVPVEDEDLVLFDGSEFTLFFDGSMATGDPTLDLDAAQYVECNGHLLLSFDGGGIVDGVSFDDNDVLEYDGAGNWEKVYDPSASLAYWGNADLDALHATVDPGAGPAAVFGQTILGTAAGDLGWTHPVAWRGVRGLVQESAEVGAYQVDATFSDIGSILSDPLVPPVGWLYWYLFKPAGCAATSWQSTLGAEPGRDVIPY
jgi:hypothetical protein